MPLYRHPPTQEQTMTDSTFDPKSILESYRAALAPALKAQQDGAKMLERLSQYQYGVAGDYLEWSLAQSKAAVGAQTPTDFVAKQVELTTALGEKLRARAQELVALASDAQATVTEAVKGATIRVVEEARKKAG